MVEGIYTAARGLKSNTGNMSVVANNLANLNTTGFKREMPFSEHLKSESESYVTQYTDFSQGEVTYTNNPLDVALVGKGYFTVDTGEQTQFTRNGKFQINNEGYLVTSNGYKVMGQNGEINFHDYMLQSDQNILITKEGEIRIGKNTVDSLKITKIEDENSLRKEEGACFSLREGEGIETESDEFEIAQGYLEESNVNPIVEMEAMIKMSKDYESAHKIVQAIDQSLEKSNEMGRV